MKKKILIGIAVVFVFFVLWVVYGLFIAAPVSPPATATYNEGGLEITVTYHQPSKKGRLIFGTAADEALQPYGNYWRLGANAATEITFNKAVTFGSQQVAAGSYRMYAIPGPKNFQVILNSETDVFFGAVEPDKALDVVAVDAAVEKLTDVVETFTIDFSGSGTNPTVNFSWDQTRFTVPISVQ